MCVCVCVRGGGGEVAHMGWHHRPAEASSPPPGSGPSTPCGWPQRYIHSELAMKTPHTRLGDRGGEISDVKYSFYYIVHVQYMYMYAHMTNIVRDICIALQYPLFCMYAVVQCTYVSKYLCT